MSTTEKKLRRQHHDTEPTTDNTDDDQETPVDYLSRNNTTTLVKDAVRVLLANRPNDPLQFLVDYFAPRESKSVESAYEKLCWTDYSMPVYQRNVLEVYDALITMKNEGSRLSGLLGSRFNELLQKLANDLPGAYFSLVYDVIQKRPDHVISFNTFYHDVLLLHVLKDFISLAQAMHKDLDVHEAGRVSQKLCTLVADRLFVSFTQQQTLAVVDKLADLSLDQRAFDTQFVQWFLENADSALSNEDELMDEVEFVRHSIVKFLDHTT